jgi:HK97 family phage prohead protease
VGKIFQYKTLVTEFKDVDMSSMTVAGYFSAFDKVDSYNEVALKGSFKKSLDENRDRIKYLLNHDVTKNLGPLNELMEDDYGLFYRAAVLPTTFGKDFMVMVQGGVIKEHSIGYKEIASRQEGNIKYITEHKLMEGSALTGWGVNQYTPMVKSAEQAQDRIKTLEAFCKNTTATDETIQLLMLEIKQLHQLLIDTTPAAVKAPEPEKAKGLDADLILTYLSLHN